MLAFHSGYGNLNRWAEGTPQNANENHYQLEATDMKPEIRADRAFKELQAIGAPVMHFGQGVYSAHTWFVISAENNQYQEYNATTGEWEGETVIWADYYGEFGSELPEVDPRIEKILDKHGLVYEWYDNGTITVYAN